jgi:hypothetical protein
LEKNIGRVIRIKRTSPPIPDESLWKLWITITSDLPYQNDPGLGFEALREVAEELDDSLHQTIFAYIKKFRKKHTSLRAAKITRPTPEPIRIIISTVTCEDTKRLTSMYSRLMDDGDLSYLTEDKHIRQFQDIANELGALVPVASDHEGFDYFWCTTEEGASALFGAARHTHTLAFAGIAFDRDDAPSSLITQEALSRRPPPSLVASEAMMNEIARRF